MSPQRAGGTALLISSRRGRHPAAVSDSGCPTAAVFSKPARLYSFPRAIGPTDETPPETSQPPYGTACSSPSGAPDESPQQKGRSLYGSVPCSFIGCFPSPRFQPAGATGERWKPEGKAPFLAPGKGGSFEDLSSTTWAARWDRRTSSRSAGDRWRSGPWRR